MPEGPGGGKHAGEAPRLLIVATQPPAPEGSAAARCLLGLVRGLATVGATVRVVAPLRPWTLDAEVPADLDLRLVDLRGDPPWAAVQLRRLVRPRGELAVPEFLREVRAAGADCDLAYLDEIDTAWCDRGLALPRLLSLHFSALADRRPAGPWRRAGRELAELVAAEVAAARRYPVIVANSPRVAVYLRRLGARRVEVVPLTLDPTGYRRGDPGEPVAGFIGTAAWPPTRVALNELLVGVWPEVRRRVPRARLIVAGRGMAGVAPSDPPEGVEVVGEVPSARAFFASISVLVHPLRRGSGTKVKTLEAMAAGVPVVTTPAGAEGIAPNDGVVVARDGGELVRGAAALLADPDERAARGAAGRAEFDRAHSPVVVAARLLEVVRSL